MWPETWELMDQLPAYLTGGGLITALGGIVWKFLAVTAKALSDENKRLAARIVLLENNNTEMWNRTRTAEQSVSTMVATNTGVVSELAVAIKRGAQQGAELAIALKNVSRLTLELSKSVRNTGIANDE